MAEFDWKRLVLSPEDLQRLVTMRKHMAEAICNLSRGLALRTSEHEDCDPPSDVCEGLASTGVELYKAFEIAEEVVTKYERRWEDFDSYRDEFGEP